MRRLLCFITLCFFIACSSKNDSISKENTIENQIKLKEYSEISIVQEKFLEFSDLKLLLKTKPEFAKRINQRLNRKKLKSYKSKSN